jgi:hypothetical protein
MILDPRHRREAEQGVNSDLSPWVWTGGALQAAEKLTKAVILSSSEGSVFEFSSNYRFFAACCSSE